MQTYTNVGKTCSGDGALTITPRSELRWTRQVLLSHGLPVTGPRWLRGIDDLVRPSGVVFTRAHSAPETIRCVEQGGLSGAILIADRAQIDGLSLLRVIRSIDGILPCWLVTEDATRSTLQTALSLDATSVITYPIEVRELILALRKLLIDPIPGN